MSKKKQPEQERRPDLSVPDQEELEAKVRNMLDIEAEEAPEEVVSEKSEQEVVEKKSPKPISVEYHEPSSAPELPGDGVGNEEQEFKEDTDIPSDDELVEDTPEETVVNLDDAPKDRALLEEPLLEEEVNEDTDIEDDKTELGDGKPVQKDAEDEVGESELEPVIEDEKTSKAVDDIIAKDADALLEAEQEKAHPKDVATKTGFGSKIKNFFKAWWNNPKARWGTVVGLLLLLIATFVIPTSRYFVLNIFGFRGAVSLTVIDESTGQPLKNVEVTVANVSAITNTEGQANLNDVNLGSSDMVVKKLAFAEIKQKITVGMGENKVADIRLVPTGEQYSFVVTDFLTKKPIHKVEAVSGEASALSDEQGNIKITIADVSDDKKLKISFKKDDYREDAVEIDPDDKSQQPVTMVAGRKHIFVSKRSGNYDVYSIYIDGKDEKKILPGTGSERDDIALLIHPTTSTAAVVSTRSGKTNNDGFLLSSLTVVDGSGKSQDVIESEKIQAIGWINDDFVYIQAIAGASAGNAKRQRLMSYNFKTKQNNELVSSDYFNDVVIAANKIYYAPSSSYQPDSAKLYTMNADGSQKETIVNQEVWNIFRTDYDNLALSANQVWLNVRIGEQKATVINTPPTNPISRTYVDSKNRKYSLWVDQRDGKGTLLNYEISTKNEQTLKSESGINYPTYWLNDKTIVYRVSNQQQTADYVMSTDGGDSYRIGDVTNTNSLDNWYYY